MKLYFVQWHKIQRVWPHIIQMFNVANTYVLSCPKGISTEEWDVKARTRWLQTQRAGNHLHGKIPLIQTEINSFNYSTTVFPTVSVQRQPPASVVADVFTEQPVIWLDKCSITVCVSDCRVLAELTEAWVLQSTETVWYVQAAAQWLLLKSCFCSMQTSEVMRRELPGAVLPSASNATARWQQSQAMSRCQQPEGLWSWCICSLRLFLQQSVKCLSLLLQKSILRYDTGL